jgi:hypothetical protein
MSRDTSATREHNVTSGCLFGLARVDMLFGRVAVRTVKEHPFRGAHAFADNLGGRVVSQAPNQMLADDRKRTSPVVRLYSIINHAAIFTLVNCGVARNAIAARFQALIATTAAVRSTSSFSEKWRRASS